LPNPKNKSYENFMKILLIAGSHYRHRFMLEPILKSKNEIKCIIMKRESQKDGGNQFNKPINKNETTLLKLHFKKRFEKEKKVFGKNTIYDYLKKENIIEINQKLLNSKKIHRYIKKFKPHLCFLMGPGIITQKTMGHLPKKTFNIHLGLSPWYRGSATLFWPSYNLEPWKTGVTFHKLSKDADAGPIIHQSVAKLKKGMDLFDLSISAIIEGRKDLEKILLHLQKRKKIISYKQKFYGKSFSTKFFRPSHLKIIYELFNDKIVDYYLNNKKNLKLPKLIKFC